MADLTLSMPTVDLSPDALVRIAGGEIVTWAEAQRREALARRDGLKAFVQNIADMPTSAEEGNEQTTGDGQVLDELIVNARALRQPAPTAPGDGWIEWHGGENPVPGQRVDVRFRDGFIPHQTSRSEEWDWSHNSPERRMAGGADDIVAYRLALRQPDTAAVTANTVRGTITRFLTADDPTHWGEFEKRLAVAVGMAPSTAEDACMAGGEEGDVEWPESPLANALFDHVQSQFSLDRDEASEEAGEILQILANHGVDPTKLPTPADPRPDPRDAFKDLEAVLAEVEASPEYAYEQQIADLEQQVFARDEALREAREALVYYSKAEAYGRRIILNVEVMYDRGKKAREALVNISAVMGEAG
jgi:hypothetical protein